ncbi:hypothetical protein D3C86_1384820 [compost metagenome]
MLSFSFRLVVRSMCTSCESTLEERFFIVINLLDEEFIQVAVEEIEFSSRKIVREIRFVFYHIKSMVHEVTADIPVFQITAENIRTVVSPTFHVFVQAMQFPVFFRLHGDRNFR